MTFNPYFNASMILMESTTDDRQKFGYELGNIQTILEDAINRVKKITGESNITTEDEMMHALDLYMEDHADEDVFYSMHKFVVTDD
jgi:hypothetical protein